jgi:hypothetical protein
MRAVTNSIQREGFKSIGGKIGRRFTNAVRPLFEMIRVTWSLSAGLSTQWPDAGL